MKAFAQARFVAVVGVLAVLAVSSQASALDLYFDNDGTATTNIAGKGTWDTTSSLWRAGSSTGTLQTWDNSGTANAFFGTGGGTASLGGIVTLNGTINVASLIVNGSSGKGATTINGGKLVLFGGSGATPNVFCGVYTATLTINSIIADNNNVGLQLKENPTFIMNAQGPTGTVVLTAANQYTGATNVNNSCTLRLDFTAGTSSNIINTASALQLGCGSTLQPVFGAGSSLVQTFNGTTFTVGSSQLSDCATANNTNYVALGALSRNLGAVNNLYDGTAKGGYWVTTSDNGNFTAVGGQKTIIGGYMTYNSVDWATTNGANHKIIALPAASYTTGFAAGKDVNATIGTTAPGAMTVNSLRFNSAGNYTVNAAGDLVIASGGILDTSGVGGTNVVTINNNHLTSANGTDLIIINNNASANTLGLPNVLTMVINSQITDCGTTSIGLTKAGTGALVLSNSNTYTGPTTLANSCATTGGIVITSNNALGTADCGTFFINNYTSGGDSNCGYLLFRNVNYTTAEPVFMNNYAGQSSRLAPIRADGGVSSFAGPITSGGGINMDVAAGSQLTLTGAFTTSGGTVNINDYDRASYPSWTGTLVLSGSNTGLASPVALNSGTLVVTNSNALGGASNAITIGSGSNAPSFVSEFQLQGGITLPQTSVILYGNLRNLSGNNALSGAPNWKGIYNGGTWTATGGFYVDCGSLTMAGTSDTSSYASAVLHPIAFGGTSGTGTITSTVGGTNYFVPTVTGGAQWIFNTANTYKARTLVNGGSLQIKNATGLGALEVSSAGVTPGTTVANSGTLDLYGVTAQYPFTLAGGSLINSNTSTGTTLSAATGIIAIVPTSGGSGYTTTAPTITFSSGGAVAAAQLGLTPASITSISGGTKYQVGDVVGLSGNSGYAWITVDSVDVNGAITGWHLSNPGSGFTGAPTTVATMHQGAAATLAANATNFQVAQINVTTAGTNVAPTVSFGSGAAAATAYANAGVYLQGASNSIGGAGNFTINPVIADNGSSHGGFTKIGNGNLTLNAVNTYTGATGITAGTVTLGKSYALPAATSVTITGGALAMGGFSDCVTSLALQGGSVTGGGNLVLLGKLSGNGSIDSNVKVVGGNLAPGNSPGSVTMRSFAFSSGLDNFTIDITGAGFTSYDNVVYKAAMALAGANLLVNDASYAPSAQNGDKFWIVDSDNGTGSAVAGTLSFGGVLLNDGDSFTSAGGISYQINYNALGDPLATAHDVLLTASVAGVPEPATWFLVGTGALGAFAFIRRQRMK